MVETITIIVFGFIALVSGAATFFITKNIYNDEHEKIRAHINNQLIIHQEKDRAHEFSQSVFLVILAVVTSFIALYVSGKCAFDAILNKITKKRVITLASHQTPTVAAIAAPNEEFNA